MMLSNCQTEMVTFDRRRQLAPAGRRVSGGTRRREVGTSTSTPPETSASGCQQVLAGDRLPPAGCQRVPADWGPGTVAPDYYIVG